MPEPAFFRISRRPLRLPCEPVLNQARGLLPTPPADVECHQRMPAPGVPGVALEAFEIRPLRLGGVPEVIVTLADVVEQPRIGWPQCQGRLKTLARGEEIACLKEVEAVFIVIADPLFQRRRAGPDTQHHTRDPPQPRHPTPPPAMTIG